MLSINTASWPTHGHGGWRQIHLSCLFGSGSLGETAIVASRCDSRGNVLSYGKLYNSETRTWEALPSMNSKPRKLYSGVLMDGKFYIIGGVSVGNSNVLTSGEMYDFKTTSWTVVPDMFPARNREAGDNDAPAIAKAPPPLTVIKNGLYAAYYAGNEVSLRGREVVYNRPSTREEIWEESKHKTQ